MLEQNRKENDVTGYIIYIYDRAGNDMTGKKGRGHSWDPKV
jgi:hypothetical protein